MVSLSKSPDSGDTMTTPTKGTSTLQFRLANALHSARNYSRLAEYQGYFEPLRVDRYRVKSTDGQHSYYQYAYTFVCTEGHVYPNLPGRSIRCDCTAALKGQPCKHGAKVALSIIRRDTAARRAARRTDLDADEPTGAQAANLCTSCTCDLIPGADTCPVCGHPASAREATGRVTLESLFVA